MRNIHLHEVLGFLDQIDTELCEITIGSVWEPLALEVRTQLPQNQLPYREGQFICSMADISLHGKLDLQDVRSK